MTIKVTIKGEGLSLEKKTSMQKAGQIITFLGTEEDGGQPALLDRNSLTPSDSPKEAINESKAKTNAQKITVLVNYLSQKDRQEDVLIKELLLHLTKMGEKPGNFARDLRTAESFGYIYPSDVKKTMFRITVKGKGAISNQFSGEVAVKTRGKKKGIYKKAVPPRKEVVSLSIVAELEGYPGFHDLPAKADCILWVLAYADTHNIEELTPKEVELITDKLKKKLAQRDFSAHNKRNIKNSYVSLTNGKFKLQKKGIDHLKEIVKENGKKEK